MGFFTKALKVSSIGGYFLGRHIEKKENAAKSARAENEDLKAENEDLKRRLAEAEQGDQFFADFNGLSSMEDGMNPGDFET